MSFNEKYYFLHPWKIGHIVNDTDFNVELVKRATEKSKREVVLEKCGIHIISEREIVLVECRVHIINKREKK